MIVRLKGGLGNQMFQYAFGRSVSLAKKEDLFFTRDYCDSDPKRCYALGVFDVPIKFVSEPKNPVYHESPFSFNPQVYTMPKNVLFEGYWFTEKYFNRPIIRVCFSPRTMSDKSQAVAEEIISLDEKSAFLHIRRTDFTTLSEYHTNLTMNYYAAAMKLICQKVPNAKFFVFSDDPEWCKVAFPSEFTVVAHNKPGGRMFGSDQSGTEHEDLWLMSLCRHAVIANSSFSWWGAWLGDEQENRIVVGPKRWFGPALAGLDTGDITPERWIKVGY
jgi:hypothetical protein